MKVQPEYFAKLSAIGIILLLLILFTWFYITPPLSTAPTQAKHETLQSKVANDRQEVVSMTQEKHRTYQKQTAKAPESNAIKNTAPGKRTVSVKDSKKPVSGPANHVQSAKSQFNNGNDTAGGSISAADLASLAACAVEAEVVESDGNLSSDPREVAVLALQDDELEENDDSKGLAALDLLNKAIDGNFNAEDKSDFLALASDVSEKTGISINLLVAHALKADQPLVLQRQALYLAASSSLDLVENVASQSKHPLQQDAQSFLLQNELAQGRRPATTDDDIIAESMDLTE